MTEDDHRSHDRADHPHGLVRADQIAGVSDARLLWAVGLNQLLTIGQVIAGVLSGSIALLSDAAHNFNDANALLIAYIARRISKKHANEQYTFGYRRAEMIGALINLTLLAVIGLYLMYEGIKRLFQPEEIIGWVMAATAVLALIVDVGTALLLWTMSHGSLNVRARLHSQHGGRIGLSRRADRSRRHYLARLAVGGRHHHAADRGICPLAGRQDVSSGNSRPMEGAPPGLDLDALIADVVKVDGVDGLHHLHVWELDEQHRALEAHVLIPESRTSDLETIKHQIKACLSEHYSIQHSTLEFEVDGSEDCNDSRAIVPH